MLYCFILLRKWSDSRINTVIYPSHFSAFYTPIHDRPCRPLTTRLPLTILPSPYPAPPLSSLLPTLPLDPSHYSPATLTPPHYPSSPIPLYLLTPLFTTPPPPPLILNAPLSLPHHYTTPHYTTYSHTDKELSTYGRKRVKIPVVLASAVMESQPLKSIEITKVVQKISEHKTADMNQTATIIIT